MNRIITSLLLIGSLAEAADFSYVERTQITGGAMKNMAASLGRFAKGMNEPMTSTHSYSGSKKATVSAKSHEIWDLGSETITSINVERKEYSVITFAEMAEAAAAMAKQMSQHTAAAPTESSSVTAKWNASFVKNDQTRDVAGVTAHGGTLKLVMEGTDAKSGQSGSMNMDIDLWMGRVPGWEIKRDFDRKTGEKLGAQMGPQMQGLAMQGGAGAMEAMKEAGKEMAKLGEMQLASVSKMYSDAMPNMPAQPAKSSTTSESQPQPSGQSAGQIAQDEAARQAEYEAMRRAGGRFGGLGGRFGGKLTDMAKKKPTTTTEQPKPTEQASASTPAAPAQTGPGLLAEFTTEVVSYSSSVDQSAFQVPAGFKQVEHPMKKALAKNK